MKTKIFIQIFLFFSIMVTPGFFYAQVDYPTKPIQISIGYSAGGSVDMLTRGLVQEAQRYLGQRIIINYKVGAASTLSCAQVVEAKPDGYILGSCPAAVFTNAPFILDLKFDPIKETTPIIAFAKFNNMMVVKMDSPFKTFKDFVDYAKQNPGKATYGHPGVGTGLHLAMAAIISKDRIQMNLVPFLGDGPAATACLGGHIMVASGNISSFVPHVEAGNLRFIATLEEERLPRYSEIPSITELGYEHPPKMWIIIYGPKGLPDPIIKKLEDSFSKACQSSAFKELSTNLGGYMEKPIFREELLKNLSIEKARASGLFQKAGLTKK